MRNALVNLGIAILVLSTPGAARAVINPDDFVTPGGLVPLYPLVTNVRFDTDTLTVYFNGTPQSFHGQLVRQPNGVDLAVFAYDNITIIGGTVDFVGQRPIALASKGDVIIGPTLNVDARSSGIDNLGGYSGGINWLHPNNNEYATDGFGPGGGKVVYIPHDNSYPNNDYSAIATGGGFGGEGGSEWYGVTPYTSGAVAPGGSAYGNLLSSIEGGSGGAAQTYWEGIDNGSPTGGSGGGGLAIVAKGIVSVGTISANGYGSAYSGGGAGGGILLSGSAVNYTSLSAHGGESGRAYQNTDGGGGRIAIIGVNSFSFGSPLSAIDINGGGGNVIENDGKPGVITVSPGTFSSLRSVVLDGSLVVDRAGDPSTRNYEVEVRRNLTIQAGTVTLGKNQPLDLAVSPSGASTVQLSLQSGTFDTGPYSQRIGALSGLGGTVRLSDGGRLTQDGTSFYGGSIQGPGTLAVSSGARLDLSYGFDQQSDWTGTAEIGGTLGVVGGVIKTKFVSTTASAQLVKYSLSSSYLDLTGTDFSNFRGTIRLEDGYIRVMTAGALDTPAAVVFAGASGPSPHLQTQGYSTTIGSLSSNNSNALVELGETIGGSALTMGSRNDNTTYAGAIWGSTGGIIKVGSGTQTLSGELTYSGPTTVRDGQPAIQSAMGAGGTVRVEAAGTLVAGASIARSIAGVGASSMIIANSSTPISLGSSTSFLGFSNQGQLDVRASNVTLNSAGPARPGGLTTLGASTIHGDVPGTLAAPNALLVDFGEAITGYGTINTPNTLAKRTVINGVAQGTSSAEPLTFSGYIKGTGSFDNVTFTGTFSPGLSPAIVTAGSLSLASTTTLIMEIGGLDADSGYDKIEAAGTLSLNGALNVTLLGGFIPAMGNSFDILDWGTLAGTFSSINLPALGGGLSWNTSQLYTSGVLSIASASLVGDYNSNGVVDAADYVAWRKNQGTTNTLPNDPIGGTIGTAQYNQWRANFGQTAGSGAGASANAAVPEPATLLRTILVAAALSSPRRRGRSFAV